MLDVGLMCDGQAGGENEPGQSGLCEMMGTVGARDRAVGRRKLEGLLPTSGRVW